MSADLIVGAALAALAIGAVIYVVNRMGSLANRALDESKAARDANTARTDAEERTAATEAANATLSKSYDALLADRNTEHQGRLNAEGRLREILEKYAQLASPSDLAAGINDELARLRALSDVPGPAPTEGGRGAKAVHGSATSVADVPVADTGPLR